LLLKIFPTTPPQAHPNSSEILNYDLIEISMKKNSQYSKTFTPQVQTS
jgi:hypothetical protein